MNNNEVLVFENNFIRRFFHEENWYYYVEDIVRILSQYKKVNWDELKEHFDIDTINNITKNSIKLTNNSTITQEYLPRGAIFRLIDSVPSTKKRERFKSWFEDITGAELVDIACQNNEYIKKANEQLKEILAEENFI